MRLTLGEWEVDWDGLGIREMRRSHLKQPTRPNRYKAPDV
jgi:hypothetical protein